ncbi:MAG: hypothetical protein K9N09_03625 [Candidatus Cloacimonetes bacterium]|nr:hypothetical protein [Candidatus Cloacimonadota bacterium]MCF7814566.1 hypothetical protein [Candidatus Cloacimonadota bacterium]MCF7867768.1 hypothetical protein [Candidatus Cloacimonadota bacterium]MCF7883254.1 hypothetical protein [Candidatus Cloacimonadota bacterium]
MKEEKLPFFYIRTLVILTLLLIITIVVMNTKEILSDFYFLPIMEGLILLVVIVSAIYIYFKMKLEVYDDKIVFYNNKTRREFLLKDINNIEVKSYNNIIIIIDQKKETLPHSIIDSSSLFKLFYDTLIEKRPDLLDEKLRSELDLVYKNSLCFDDFTYIVEKTGFFATLMAILSFFVGMFIIVDYYSIKEFGQIAYLIYSLAWPFLAGFLLFMGFVHYLKKSKVEELSSDVIQKYFSNYPYSLVFSTFAEIFILLSVLKYFT